MLAVCRLEQWYLSRHILCFSGSQKRSSQCFNVATGLYKQNENT